MPRRDSLPLEGATVLVTRPSGTAGAFLRLVRSLGARAIAVPGLSLRAADAADRSHRSVPAFDGWIFTSPAAVRFGADTLPPRRARRNLQAFALGDGTARALARLGIGATVPRDRFDSEGLLALAELKRVRGKRIALVGAPGGRDLIGPTLRRRGARVDALHVYRRDPPRLTRRHFDAIQAADDPLITLVSSGEALGHLVALLPAAALERLRAQALVVSSARLVGIAREHAFVQIVQARSAAPRDLLAAATAALGRHRL
ncbi:MAG: uroporphyrinogen-III synthase [Rhodanobacteraceae bacterium]